MIEAVLSDDHLLIREGLKKLLSKEEDIQVVYEAGNGKEVMDFFESNRRASILILDINMPLMSGLEVLKQIRKVSPDTRILILSMYPEERFAMRALRAGADGYITKGSAGEELIGAIRKVVAGEKYLSSNRTDILLKEFGRPDDMAPHELLSEREFQIMLMLAKGTSVRAISEELGLSVNTVNTYRARLLSKMNVNTTHELIRYAFDRNLVE